MNTVKVCSAISLHQNFDGRYYQQLNAKGKTWEVGDTIDIHFMDGTDRMKDLVKTWSEEWTRYANLHFRFGVSRNNSDVRISFKKPGAYSYLGTDATFIDNRNETMNFGWLDRETVLHEFGHMLSLKHEHQHPEKPFQWEREAIINDMTRKPNNWTIRQIEHNILTPADPNKIDFSDYDPYSIMLYFFPGHWTSDGRSTKQNKFISQKDKEYVAKLYPASAENSREFLRALEVIYQNRDAKNLFIRTHQQVAKILGLQLRTNSERQMIQEIVRHIARKK